MIKSHPTRSVGYDLSINVKGNKIAYNDLGEGTIPLIFIHGFPFNRSMWSPQIEFLKKQNRVIAYDIQGFGTSDTSNSKPSISLYADDLIDLMNVLNINKAILVGLSMGGYIALNAVSRFNDRFEAVILSDTQCIADTKEAKEKRYKSIEQVNTIGLADFAAAFVKNIFSQKSLDNNISAVTKIEQDILDTPHTTVVAALAALAARYETCSILKDIAIPSLILCGRQDSVTPVAQSEFLVSQIPNSTLHIIEDAGHLANLEQPNDFNERIQKFILGLQLKN